MEREEISVLSYFVLIAGDNTLYFLWLRTQFDLLAWGFAQAIALVQRLNPIHDLLYL